MADMATEPFEDAENSEPKSPVQLVLDLDGYEGPIDVLLTLAREQKVDLIHISILQLADQFLEYVRQARQQRLELAADYLVMAAWLAYLKSRLLLPEDQDDEDGPTGEELAEALAFQLRRLESMREASTKLMALDHLGRDVFPRGAAERLEVVAKPIYAISLHDLLSAYAAHERRRAAPRSLRIEQTNLFSLDAAITRLSNMLGTAIDWTTLEQFLPTDTDDPLVARSALASTFAASLELVREGKLNLRQSGPFAPLYLRRNEESRA